MRACDEAMGWDWPFVIPFGAVVATAKLVDAFKVTHYGHVNAVKIASGQSELGKDGLGVIVDALGDYSLGRWVWLLEDIEPVDPPVLARGYQGWWEWTPQEMPYG